MGRSNGAGGRGECISVALEDGVNDWLRMAVPVAEAIASGRPVVALETTLVTHGLPRPEGVRTALELEAAVRERGAMPATIGLLDGAVRVGLDASELERLAAPPTPDKINLSNLAAHLAHGARGSTTVAATMLVAHRVGIAVMATGGIGGVHRGAAESGDVFADLAAVPPAGRGGLLRCQGDPRLTEDGRDAGNARGAGARVRHRRAAGILPALERAPDRRALQ